MQRQRKPQAGGEEQESVCGRYDQAERHARPQGKKASAYEGYRQGIVPILVLVVAV